MKLISLTDLSRELNIPHTYIRGLIKPGKVFSKLVSKDGMVSWHLKDDKDTRNKIIALYKESQSCL